MKIRCACCASRAFAARYAHLGFRIAEETQALMAAMVEPASWRINAGQVWKRRKAH